MRFPTRSSSGCPGSGICPTSSPEPPSTRPSRRSSTACPWSLTVADRRYAVISGASSGIGAATAVRLADDGWDVTIGARREDRLREVAARSGARAFALDVTDPASADPFCDRIDDCALLVLSAGGALGLDAIAEADEDDWQQMWQVNVMGSLRLIQRLLPKLVQSGSGHIILLGSIAGRQPYVGGGGYNAVKFAVRAMRDVLRLELLGQPVRVTEIAPGMVKTPFSEVRFKGDRARAAAVYQGVDALLPEDIAECIAWVASRPPHVAIEQLVVQPLQQADARTVHGPDE
ncbi:MAG: SDR family NAD(P)-dependent oxidoreductase [Solirubrobacterales bacterium]|nr:SDR family NAD(P)-dependent oxidoreductase [Solirubrobacterales bacterium]